MKYRTSSTFSSYLLSIDRLVSPNPNILCATYRKRKWRLRRNWKELFLLCEMERHHLTDNINMCGLFARRGEDFVGLLRVCASLLPIKGGGRPTRLLPHAKMLLIPIKFFFLCWVDYALEGSTFSLSKCDFSRMFHTERSWHTYRFTVVIVSGRQDFPSDTSAFSLTSFEA